MKISGNILWLISKNSAISIQTDLALEIESTKKNFDAFDD